MPAAEAASAVTWPDFLSLIKGQGYSGKGDDLEEVKTWLKSNGFDPNEMAVGDQDLKLDELWKSRPGRKLDARAALDSAQRRKERQEDLDAALKALGYDKPVQKARTNGTSEDHSASISVKDMIEDDPTLGYGKYDENGLGLFLGEVRKAADCAKHGRLTDMPERLVKSQKIIMQKAGQGLNEAVDSEGGFLTMPEHNNTLLRKMHDAGLVYTRARVVSMTKKQTTLPFIVESSRVDGSRHGGVQGYWQAEGASKTDSQPAFGRLTLTAHKLYAYGFVTDELEEDADPAALQLMGELFAEELAFKLDDAFIRGTGAGQPLGILNAPATVSVDREGSSAGTITGHDIGGMWARMWARSRPNAVWFINQDCEMQLTRLSVDTNSNTLTDLPVLTSGLTFGEGQAGVPGTHMRLYGRPVVPIEQCSTVGTVGDIILADMTQYLYGNRRGITTATSIHVAFATDEMAFKATLRADGQPWWDSALTPYQGTNTQSPFVTLATA